MSHRPYLGDQGIKACSESGETVWSSYLMSEEETKEAGITPDILRIRRVVFENTYSMTHGLYLVIDQVTKAYSGSGEMGSSSYLMSEEETKEAGITPGMLRIR